MKIKEESFLIQEGDNFLTIESKVDESKLSKLYSLLSNIYRNPIGSIVREYVSNAIDATTEAGSENPVLVKVKENGLDLNFIVEDFGVGLSPERMHNIYFNYLSSTKESTNDLIGGFGIGSKSALAYTHTFFINTTFNKTHYKYIMSKQENGIPAGQLLHKEETDKLNGTEIVIPIKTKEELVLFKSECKKQLAYFENVYYEVSGINNSFKIYEGDTFRFNAINTPFNELHICLGNVPYTIDWTELGISVIKVPLALKFNIGELIPTPSRESIEYTINSKKLILEKIEKLKAEVASIYNKQIHLEKGIDDLKTYCEAIKQPQSINLDGHLINLNIIPGLKSKLKLPEFTGLKVKGKTVKLSSTFSYSNVINAHFSDTYSQDKYNPLTFNYSWTSLPKVITSIKRENILFIKVSKRNFSNKSDANAIIREYAKNRQVYSVHYAVTGNLEYYKTLLNLKIVPKSEWRNYIISFQNLIKNELKSNFDFYPDLYEKIKPTNDWLLQYGEKYGLKRKAKLESEITCKRFFPNRYSYDKIDIKQRLTRSKVFYCEHDRKEELEVLMSVFSLRDSDIGIKTQRNSLLRVRDTGRFKVITVAKNKLKLLKNLENFIYVDNFMEYHKKIFSEICTAIKVKKELNKIPHKVTSVFKFTIYSQDYIDALNYVNKHIKNDEINGALVRSAVKLAEREDLIDKTILEKVERLNKVVVKLPLLEYLSFYSNDNIAVSLVIQYIRSQGILINSLFTLKLTEQELFTLAEMKRLNFSKYTYNNIFDRDEAEVNIDYLDWFYFNKYQKEIDFINNEYK